MNKYLPSKQFTRIILATLGVAALIFIVGKFVVGKKVWEKKQGTDAVTLVKDGDFFAKDSDGDGLYDWEEALWGTNPEVKDSDEDGVPDKEFVEHKRREISQESETTYDPDDTNQTEVFAKQLFTTSAVLNQTGTLSNDDLEKFSENISRSVDAFDIKDKYSLGDLSLSNVSTDTYFNDFSKVYNSLPNLDIQELYTIAYMIEKPNDPIAIENISKLIVLYGALRDGMLTMNIPYANAGNHLAIINDTHRMTIILKEMSVIDSDPLRSVSYFAKYQEYSESLEKNFDYLKAFFAQNGIV